ncbi:MAG: tRNA (adenosine(37)-N6)-threonylcarbamoyltransferase complex dimerization subunit type 1 TsaB [Thermoanaerobaculia bacterium]
MAPDSAALLLALDSGSPRVSVAAGWGGAVVACRVVEQASSSRRLIGLIEEVLAEVGSEVRQLGGVVALSGPGSFTGLRVGLATAMGLAQALDLPALALPSLAVLAQAAAPGPVRAAVAGIRGSWFVQDFTTEPGAAPGALSEPYRLAGAELAAPAGGRVAGFGLEALAGLEGLCAPPPLAPVALELARLPSWSWDLSRLSEPLYLSEAQATLPSRKIAEPAA